MLVSRFRAVPFSCLILLLARPALADRAVDLLPSDPLPAHAPGGLRDASEIEWVRVHLPGQSPCPPASASGDGQTEEHVWCFEGAGGDSTWPAGSGAWSHGVASGAPDYDGWRLTYDPAYAGEGNTCTFTDDWLWSAKESPVPPEANGFHFLLVSPSIPVGGWTGGLVQYDFYQNENGREDYPNTVARAYDTATGWSAWDDFDGFLTGGGGFWIFDKTETFTDLLGPTVDSVQVAWELIDMSSPGSPSWGKHGGVRYFVDNVSFGRFDGTVTTFTARVIDVFTETFSLSDPAHTPFLGNDEQGDWIGVGGSRVFESDDSLTVSIEDPDGVTPGNVLLWWSTDGGAAWHSKPMSLSLSAGPTGGDYRAIIGADDGGVEDMTDPGDGIIWDTGTLVDWYVEVTDDASNACTWPAGAPDETHEFRVLPFGNTSPAQNGETYLVVEDHPFPALDVESSSGFDPTGGTGGGAYEEPAYARTTKLVRDALDALGLVYDRYVVQGSGSSVQTEPRGFADPDHHVGGLMDESGIPNYDCVLWIHAPYAVTPMFEDESRLSLAAFLDGGGHLVTTGDDVASNLGAGGLGFDPAFLADYLGTSFHSGDGETDTRILNSAGVAPGPLDGVVLGVYGECPVPRGFDRLTLADPQPGSAASVLMEYANGGPGDDGRASVILNERTASGGRAVLAAFDPGALLSLESRSCLLGSVLDELGLTIPNAVPCVNNGVGAPPARAERGFWLSAGEPNPFREKASIHFAVPRPLPVTLAVYDVLGRRIRTILEGPVPAGSHAGQWDGRSDTGERVASGIYFFRLEAGDFRESRKTVLLR